MINIRQVLFNDDTITRSNMYRVRQITVVYDTQQTPGFTGGSQSYKVIFLSILFLFVNMSTYIK